MGCAPEPNRARNEFVGRRAVGIIYSDNAPEFKAACQQLSLVHETSQPGNPKTNGIIERCNGDILALTRTGLVTAGLPACFWPNAAQRMCFNDDVL